MRAYCGLLIGGGGLEFKKFFLMFGMSPWRLFPRVLAQR